MKIVATHSHFNGLEYVLVHKPELWRKIKQAIERLQGGDDTQIRDVLSKAVVHDVRIALDVQLNDEFDSASEAFAKHYLQYVRDEIDVGIEILPMKSLQSQMSSGPGYYEGELYNVIRNGRGVPAVPLAMIGVAP
jgi:hypothetical protein